MMVLKDVFRIYPMENVKKLHVKNSPRQNVVNIFLMEQEKFVYLMEIIADFNHVQKYLQIFAKLLNLMTPEANVLNQARVALFLPVIQ
jgi:hypothetical protein